MENQLSLRDKVGLDDFLLLENYQDENAFIENLRKRFNEKIIYTYIGQVLISVNPNTFVDIYNENYIRNYRNANFYEFPPHIFAIADSMYRVMKHESKDQFVLISGESGSGKTEASKKVLLYLSAISKCESINKINKKLINSNPILESFGCSKTIKNDNSSRFGKYMNIEFNYADEPCGGEIVSYLLEKSRVVHQNIGDQNFHIFYQLISDELTLKKLQLKRDPSHYYYLNQGETCLDYNIDHSKELLDLQSAFKVFDFTNEEEENIYKIIAAIIHLGQVGFLEEDGQVIINDNQSLRKISKLIDCDENDLKQAFTNKSFEVKGENVSTPLTRDQAIYARDALAKAIYERLFNWIIRKLNDSLKCLQLNNAYKEKKSVIGLLDIFGFEIFENNSFEQFNINYCNEKLQQLFIELTLKSEQEEYIREELVWEPVNYFNNAIICDLIEAKHNSIISILDEECLRPGDSSDNSFLTKLGNFLGEHPHFATYNTAKNELKKQLKSDNFYINHYAGDVIYNVKNFLDKNNDLLYRDLKKSMCNSRNQIIQTLFPIQELNEKKRPPTVTNQFKNSLNQLMQLLKSKEPWYIRCIKPNESKKVVAFSDQIVRHQVKYLGLMENLRVRRAGFAYRRDYEYFLKRYKSLCKETWPAYKGESRDGVECLIKHLNFKSDEYFFGKSKIFIRFPNSLFYIEELFQQKKLELIVFLQKNIRMALARNNFLRKRNAVTKISSYYKMYKAKCELQKRKWAANKIREFIKGFITRKQLPNEYNEKFNKMVKFEWLISLSKQYPKKIIDKNWPKAPEICQKTLELLKPIHRKCLVKSYCSSISTTRKQLLEEKVLAENLFKLKKANYPLSVNRIFEQSRLDENELKNVKNIIKSEKIIYASTVCKINRKGYKCKNKILVITNLKIYLAEKPKKMKDNDNSILIERIHKLHVSPLSDGFIIIEFSNDLKSEKNDYLIIDLKENIFEMIVKLSKVCEHIEKKLNIVDSIKHNSGDISFSRGLKNELIIGKNNILQVVSVN